MDRQIILVVIGIIIISIIILESIIYAKRIIKNGIKIKAKIVKIEKEITMSADCDDPGIMRHWFNLEVELNNEILKRQVAITDYTKSLKVGDYINIVVYKKDFLMEDELRGYKKWKK